MNRKIAYAAVAIIFLGLVGGITGDDDTQTVEEVATPQENTPEEQLKDEFGKVSFTSQVKSVSISDETVCIVLGEPGHKDGAHFQELMGYSTIGIMEKATELSKEYGFNAVMITCECSFIDGDGNKFTDEGYEAIIPISSEVNWGNFEYAKNPLSVVKTHALKVYIHPKLS